MARIPVLVADAVRTPFGPHGSKMAGFHAVDLLTAVFDGVLERSGIPASRIDHVIAGCAVPIGEQAINIARNAALAAGWRESIPSHTLDAQGTSGVLALHEAVGRVMSGMSRVCVVGAVSSTRVPDGSTTGVAVGKPFGSTVHDRFAEHGGLRSPGLVNEHLAAEYNVTREDLDDYARRSLAAACSAEELGVKNPYLLEISDKKRLPTIVSRDEVPKNHDITKLKPLFETNGLLTAATFANPASGAVAMIVAHPDELSRDPLGEISQCTSAGSSVLGGSSGVAVARTVINAKLRKQLAHIEVQEDSAVAPTVFEREFDCEAVNEWGGNLALGDPFGASGLASICALLHSLEPSQKEAGLAVSAGANAISTATVVRIHT